MYYLSRAVLKCFFRLQREIEIFLSEKEKPGAKPQDEEWLQNFVFLVNMMGHFKALNMRMQDWNEVVTEFYDAVRDLEMKLFLWEKQLSVQRSMFPHLEVPAQCCWD